MKIEIGESLMLSYLKHVKKCVIYQLNWKSSSNWEIKNMEKVKYIYQKIKYNLIFDVFKKSNYEQLIKQAEIDVLGFDGDDNVYAIDIAFHEAGLNYGSKEETKDRILKKLLRSYLALLSYFPNKKYKLIFASPKVNNATEEIINTYFSELVKCFSNEDVEFKYTSNNNFKNDILIPTIKSSSEDSDGNELFLRAVKMFELFNMYSVSYEFDRNIINQYNNYPKKEYFLEGMSIDKNKFAEKLKNNICQVKVTIFYGNDKAPKEKIWDVKKFKDNTSLDSNINSGFLRDWQDKGIIGIKLEILNGRG